jgi:hypothetical protein
VDLDVPKIRVLGTGSSFAEAWNKCTPLWQCEVAPLV